MHWYCCNNTVPMLNKVRTLTFRSVANFQIFEISLDFDYQPAMQPAIRPTTAKCTAPEISHNKGNCGGFTKLLLRLRFVHCAMMIPFILHYPSLLF